MDYSCLDWRWRGPSVSQRSRDWRKSFWWPRVRSSDNGNYIFELFGENILKLDGGEFIGSSLMPDLGCWISSWWFALDRGAVFTAIILDIIDPYLLAFSISLFSSFRCRDWSLGGFRQTCWLSFGVKSAIIK